MTEQPRGDDHWRERAKRRLSRIIGRPVVGVPVAVVDGRRLHGVRLDDGSVVCVGDRRCLGNPTSLTAALQRAGRSVDAPRLTWAEAKSIVKLYDRLADQEKPDDEQP